ncbi:hypothetical protein B0H11DRAFT_767093 [Mycena galericulata]|nr:hypothetical protein B0H11DRAFT_1283545 [Mycena galericulata]KAJ7500795.1 hypothetical protein B0H11DRAFT_767093 [Mycena galericulata]
MHAPPCLKGDKFYLQHQLPPLIRHLVDRYIVCKHRQWLEYTGKKVECALPTCRTSPQHIHSPTQKCGCHAYVEDIEKTRNIHDTICPGCQELRRESHL